MQVMSLERDDANEAATIGLGGKGSWPPQVGVTYPDV